MALPVRSLCLCAVLFLVSLSAPVRALIKDDVEDEEHGDHDCSPEPVVLDQWDGFRMWKFRSAIHQPGQLRERLGLGAVADKDGDNLSLIHISHRRKCRSSPPTSGARDFRGNLPQFRENLAYPRRLRIWLAKCEIEQPKQRI